MKLPELLKKAVLEQDWKAVCAAYTAITGEPLSPPKPPEPPKPDFLNMEISPELLEQLGLDSHEETDAPSDWDVEPFDEEATAKVWAEQQEEVVESEESKKNDYDIDNNIPIPRDVDEYDTDGETRGRREPIPIKKRVNRFVDNPSVASSDLKANNPILQKTYEKVGSHTAQTLLRDKKDTGKKTKVVCSFCGTPDIIATALAVGWSTNKEKNTYKCTSCCTPAGRDRVLRKQRDDELSGRGTRRRS